MPFAATWMDLKIIILCEGSQKEKDKYHMISLICRIYNMIQMNLFTKQKDSQTQKTNLWLPKGKGGGGGDKLGVWDQQVQTTIYKIDKQHSPTVQHRELYSVFCKKP